MVKFSSRCEDFATTGNRLESRIAPAASTIKFSAQDDGLACSRRDTTVEFSRLLICPGAQKAGTTWLHRLLRKHPQFWMPPQKELDYLFYFRPSREKYAVRMGPKLTDAKTNPATREWIETFLNTWDLANYPRLFERAGERFAADISPNYSRMSTDEVRRAAAVVPDAKIVFTLRDPIERAWSHAKNASKTWNISDARAKIRKCNQFVNSAVCDLMSDYPRLIRDWRAAFGSERVTIVFYEELALRPDSFINRILTFAGAPPFPDKLSGHLAEHHNRGDAEPVPEPVRASLLVRYDPMLSELRKLLGSPTAVDRQPGWVTGQATRGYPVSIQA